jgi:hypothetical protein
MRLVLVLAAACTSASSAPSPAAAAPHATTATPTTAPRPAVEHRAPNIGDPSATGTVRRVAIAAAVGDLAATDRPTYARADQPVTLYAVLEVEHDGTRSWFTDAPVLELAGKRRAARPLARAPAVELAWNRIEPAEANISNGEASTFHYEPIDYQATVIDGATNRASIAADVRPTLTPDHGGGVGTMRYQLIARQGGRTITSPGPEARRGGASGGLTDAVLRVSIRRDDSYLGYLTEMFGQPYVWASAGRSDRTHQSERLEGSDCADFIIYGARRMGANLPYTWTGGLPAVTRLLASGSRADDGVYRDAHGVALPFTRVGDLVLFPRHVGALVEDRGIKGVLDDQDLIMHTLFDSPKIQPLADSGYADRPAELRRFTRDLRPARSRD